ncbi:MAG: DUF1206 domain-containing protein [Aphanothece sp. CMT-3BRIN-NPC111]|jgi:hypothetical protein|nr:DUF1206 domain-containing protein [Aphanothece sp. CMT-3BRIN-NPC111]
MTQEHDGWVERLARFGYAAKGIVYAIVGVLATQVAFGRGGKTTDTKGALQTIVTQPFGKFLLALVAIGLLGYVLWLFVQAIKDPEKKGTDAKGILQRVGYGATGLIYAGLAFSAVKIILGSGGGGSSNSTQDWTARLLAQPFGQWLVGAVGAATIGMGFYQFYEAYSAKFRKNLKLNQMSNTEKTWATRLGRFGLGARGVVFVVIGFLLIQAGRHSNAKEAQGLDGALDKLLQQPYGAWLLGVVALGLVAYGIYQGVLARYRRITAPQMGEILGNGAGR